MAVAPALNSTDKDTRDVKKKAGTAPLDAEADDTPSSLRAIKSFPGHVATVGKKLKDLEADFKSPKKHAFSDSSMFDCPCLDSELLVLCLQCNKLWHDGSNSYRAV